MFDQIVNNKRASSKKRGNTQSPNQRHRVASVDVSEDHLIENTSGSVPRQKEAQHTRSILVQHKNDLVGGPENSLSYYEDKLTFANSTGKQKEVANITKVITSNSVIQPPEQVTSENKSMIVTELKPPDQTS
mmetsp:Transcript_550/g.612  ORF Transcript_550/g.612 Transcript_550/m.612 type:complete len:132 (+) Transcript_550:847-1242(+)